MDRIIFPKYLQLSVKLADFKTDPSDLSFKPHEKIQDTSEIYRYKRVLKTVVPAYQPVKGMTIKCSRTAKPHHPCKACIKI